MFPHFRIRCSLFGSHRQCSLEAPGPANQRTAWLQRHSKKYQHFVCVLYVFEHKRVKICKWADNPITWQVWLNHRCAVDCHNKRPLYNVQFYLERTHLLDTELWMSADTRPHTPWRERHRKSVTKTICSQVETQRGWQAPRRDVSDSLYRNSLVVASAYLSDHPAGERARGGGPGHTWSVVVRNTLETV